MGVLFEMGLGCDGFGHIPDHGYSGIQHCPKTTTSLQERAGDTGQHQRNGPGIFFGNKNCPGVWHGVPRDKEVQNL